MSNEIIIILTSTVVSVIVSGIFNFLSQKKFNRDERLSRLYEAKIKRLQALSQKLGENKIVDAKTTKSSLKSVDDNYYFAFQEFLQNKDLFNKEQKNNLQTIIDYTNKNSYTIREIKTVTDSKIQERIDKEIDFVNQINEYVFNNIEKLYFKIENL